MNDKLKKYLNFKSLHNYGKPSKVLKNKKFDFFMVIPCYNEYEYIFKTLDSIDKQNSLYFKNLLIIIVINNAKNSPNDVIKNNSKTYNKIIGSNYNFNIIAIDAFSKKHSISVKKSGFLGEFSYFKLLNDKDQTTAILASIFQLKDRTVFVKLSSSAIGVNETENDFLKFCNSLRKTS